MVTVIESDLVCADASEIVKLHVPTPAGVTVNALADVPGLIVAMPLQFAVLAEKLPL
ncbi:MAG TPA: hypothetical protein VFO29_04470 [Candidatus Rubrimentiphilum sp.]|nr:hypothetical protein [Candidatus Rubrimentiphilum sp.]